MSEFDAIEALAQAGIPVQDVSEDERAVYASLSEEEVAVLSGLKARLTAANGDVEAHELSNGGNFW
ncbi:MAG TPA: aroma-sacti cluster domain-containing protein [Actinocrinis sp.]|uniref:aroma-sacti cluster domain-containing protein n=1 Tax=Actinocrinis sp. TaxID=1920516 RepID=UPI002DDCD01C|nr:aroma-sacti cluster domain-containing protein [Actinocrinis sp.]HEV2344266.1 aroma-sacti cluster domain-containing protein [Actinocrinis sp.]